MTEAMADLNKNTANYSLESDWRDLSYYTSRVIDMVTSSQDSSEDNDNPLSKLMSIPGAMAEGPWTMVSYANFSQVGIAIDMAMKKVQNLTSDDLDVWVYKYYN